MRSESWPLVRLADLIEIKHGFAFRGEHFQELRTKDVLLTPGNFRVGGGFKDEKLKYYDGPVDEEFVLSEGDLLVTMTDLSRDAGTLGYPAAVPRSQTLRYLHNQRLGRVTIRQDAPLDKGFLYFALCSPRYRHEVLASATGTTVRHTSPSRIGKYSLPLPPVKEQRAIARVLEALDAKVEHNRLLARTLNDASAELLESVVPKDQANLPSGWSSTTLGSKLTTLLGGTPSRKIARYWSEGSVRWFGSGKVNDLRVVDGTERITPEAVKDSATKLMPPRTTLIAITGATMGKVSLLEIEACANQSVVGVLPEADLPAEYIYLWIRRNIHEVLRRQTGAAQQHINKRDVDSMLLLVPPVATMRRFEDVVRPMFDLIRAALEESVTIDRLRARLLPGLIDGTISVRTADT